MKTICMIPARVDSKRFPGKIFAKFGKISMLGQVIEAAKNVSLFDEVIVAGCSKEVLDIAKFHGVRGILTDKDAPNGTMRIIEAIHKEGIAADLFVNWQADEPFITEEVIKTLLIGADSADILTLKKKIDKENAMAPSTVKVVTDQKNHALYFSRSMIPFEREGNAIYYKHIGLYAFSYNALLKIKGLEQAPVEISESLEQLRWLHHGLNIKVNETDIEIISIDTEEDLNKVKILKLIDF